MELRLNRFEELDWRATITGALTVALIVFLCLDNGGYDPIPRDQIGITVWWILLLGILVAALPVSRQRRSALIALCLLGGFASWTALALIWTESAERTATELTRIVTYLGVFGLAICLVGQGRNGTRAVLNGVIFGLGLVVALAVLSRLHMDWFPPNELERLEPGLEIARRLSYPLNYSSGVGALVGMTIPLLLAATSSARSVVFQALAAATIPVAGLALYLATSGTGIAVAAVSISAYLILAPDRMPKVLTLLYGAAGATILAIELAGREAVARGLPTAAADREGTELIWIALAVCLGVAFVYTATALFLRGWKRPRWMTLNRREMMIAAGTAVIVVIGIVIATGLADKAIDRWEVFKSRSPAGPGLSSPSTAVDFKGNGRYQFWESAVEAGEAEPWTGIGPGTFEFWWARNGSYGGFIRDAHSLYAESFAELGALGLLLIGGFVLTVVGVGAARSLRGPPEDRVAIAAATAGCAGFTMAAALDWVWELAAIPVVFLFLAAVAINGFPRTGSPTHSRAVHGPRRAVVVGVAAVAIVVIWIPLRGTSAVQQSQIDASGGNLVGALDKAREAVDIEPYAASPRIQEALVLEQQGRIKAATEAAGAATKRESTNWRTWLILARLQAENGEVEQSVGSYRRAHSLAPKLGI